MDAPDCDRFLFRGALDAATVESGPVRIERRALGRIELPDGRIFACDPLVPMETASLALRLAPGSYEVVVFTAVGSEQERETPARQRTAAAAIICGTANPVTWELAAREGGAPDAAAYGVDSGTGAFLGSDAIDAIVESGPAADAILEELKGCRNAVIAIPGGAVVAVFESGDGDGVYNTWVGRDQLGQPCMVLTDFEILDTSDHVAAVKTHQAERAAKKWWEFWK
jgi:hypothetical protein